MHFFKRIKVFFRTRKLKKCGKTSFISKNCCFQGGKNISVGERCHIGQGAFFVSTRANIIIKDDVVFGPFVMIYTGDHPLDILGKHISEISDKDKTSGRYDEDVLIESGCWIGARAIILKGVKIGRGSVVGAGSIVTKSIPPYSIYTGVPSKKVRSRFNEEEIKTHEQLLKKRGKL